MHKLLQLQGFLLKFTPGFRQAWAKMLDVEGGFNPLVKVGFLFVYFGFCLFICCKGGFAINIEIVDIEAQEKQN